MLKSKSFRYFVGQYFYWHEMVSSITKIGTGRNVSWMNSGKFIPYIVVNIYVWLDCTFSCFEFFSPSRLTFVGWSQGKTKLWRLWLNVLKSTENSITNSPFLWRNLNNIPHYLQIFTKSLFVLSFDVVLLRYFTIKFPKCFVITHNIYYVVCENLVIRSSLSPTNHSHILACTYFFDLSVKCENNCRFVFKEGVKAKVRTHALFFSRRPPGV